MTLYTIVQALPEVDITSAFLLAGGGILISLLASYVPGFREWFAGLPEVTKQLAMLLSMVFLTLVVGVLSFTGVWELIPATKEGVIILLIEFGLALVSNSTTYTYSPQVRTVREIKNNQ